MIKKFSIDSEDYYKTPEVSKRNIKRPQSTVPYQVRNSYSHKKNQRKEKLRSSSATKTPTLGLNINTESRNNICLKIEDMNKIYIAKCQDLGIPTLPDQEKRFFNYACLHFRNRKFDLSETGIGSKSGRIIGEILKENPNFAYLYLGKNSIKDAGAIDLLINIKNSNFIVHLDVSSNDISPEGSKKILKMIEKNESLISFDISSHEGLHRNRLCTEGAESLQRLLAFNKVLLYLNVSGTSLGPEGCLLMIKGLESNLTLISLNLSSNGLGSKIIEKLAYAVVGTELKELFIANNKIGNEGCDFLGLMLSGGYDGFCMLNKLDISDNEITIKGLSVLLAAIRINTAVCALILKKNNFSKGLSSNFYQFLTDNNTVSLLDFSNCGIKCEGLSNIGEGLLKNKSLKTLILSENKIKDRGVEMICYGLNKNKTLRTLDLNSNEIKNKGALVFSRVLKNNNSLECLFLKDNSIKDSGGEALCELVRFNHHILQLSLDLNPLNFKFITDIKVNLRHNQNLKNQELVPKLQEKIEKSQDLSNDIQKVFNKISQKIKEQNEGEVRLKGQGEKLEVLKKQEREKTEELKARYLELKSKSFALSTELESYNNQINVNLIQKIRMQGEKQISEMSNKIGFVAVQIKNSEKNSKI